MTSAVLTQAPLAAGGAMLGAIARALRWGVARYARAPLSNTAITGLAAFSLMASANAMFLQEHKHPAPFYGPAAQQVAAVAPVPAGPSLRPKPAPVKQVTTTGSVPPLPVVSSQPIGNDEVIELQVKLKAMGLLEGAADGLYGPQTARAIRRFEEQAGLPPKGELTREVLASVRAAPIAVLPLLPQEAAETPITAPAAIATAVPAPNAQPEETAPGPAAADEAEAMPLPPPTPLAPTMQAAAPPESSGGRPLPADGNQLLAVAGEVADNAVTTLVAAVNGNGVRMGPSAQPMPPKAAPVAAADPDAGADAVAATAADASGGDDPVADIVTAEMEPVPTVPAATPANDPKLVAKVQRGLASLGFLRGDIDGIPGEATAKAIRNFEVWNNYDVTGRVSPQLLDLLVSAGAQI